MKNVFEVIRNSMSMPDVAKFYGLQISHSGMACCPFHNDNTPSMKIYEDNYFCFGCGSTGDCTGFVAKLFNISQLEAAKKICYDFGLRLFTQEIAVPVQIVLSPEREYQQWLQNARLSVSKYLILLNEWRVKYKPRNSFENLHPHFEESLFKQAIRNISMKFLSMERKKINMSFMIRTRLKFYAFKSDLKNLLLRNECQNAEQFNGGILL